MSVGPFPKENSVFHLYSDWIHATQSRRDATLQHVVFSKLPGAVKEGMVSKRDAAVLNRALGDLKNKSIKELNKEEVLKIAKTFIDIIAPGDLEPDQALSSGEESPSSLSSYPSEGLGGEFTPSSPLGKKIGMPLVEEEIYGVDSKGKGIEELKESVERTWNIDTRGMTRQELQEAVRNKMIEENAAFGKQVEEKLANGTLINPQTGSPFEVEKSESFYRFKDISYAPGAVIERDDLQLKEGRPLLFLNDQYHAQRTRDSNLTFLTKTGSSEVRVVSQEAARLLEEEAKEFVQLIAGREDEGLLYAILLCTTQHLKNYEMAILKSAMSSLFVDLGFEAFSLQIVDVSVEFEPVYEIKGLFSRKEELVKDRFRVSIRINLVAQRVPLSEEFSENKQTELKARELKGVKPPLELYVADSMVLEKSSNPKVLVDTKKHNYNCTAKFNRVS